MSYTAPNDFEERMVARLRLREELRRMAKCGPLFARWWARMMLWWEGFDAKSI